MSAEDFKTYSVHISEEFKDSGGNLNNRWILDAAVNPLLYINDLFFLEAGKTLKLVREANSEAANVGLVQNAILETSLA